MYGLKSDITIDTHDALYCLEDYEKQAAKWCPGCGDHAVLTNIQKLCRDEQLDPAKTVFVSGIGCSSRFPHYMNTFGFHGLHGRAFPVASGIKYRRPDLSVFVITGDGDCCSIGAGAWIHAVRYNIDMTVMLFNNETYGLTKNQTSPTSRVGTHSNTTPHGSVIPPIHPVQTTLGVSNVSFVAQTVDWNPPHMYATLKAAHEHKGFSFVHILQRCPKFQANLVEKLTTSKDDLCLLNHENGITLDEATAKSFKHFEDHDPTDINRARMLAEDKDKIYLGLFYQNKNAVRYDQYGAANLGFTVDEKIEALNRELDKFAV
ncbi:MAG: thiamine pyrophosphate-dependent enzyme [Cyclobacteriaceae bacterium]|nr:thiamine pyrophosphate-dependent enzyme [Cyclobacteriaceae bacterium]